MNMKKKPSGLGRGLGALIPNHEASAVPAAAKEPDTETKATAEDTPLEVALDRIAPNPEQPRRVFKEAELDELMQSIREHGILQPLVVNPVGGGNYELVAGERRLRASKMLGLEKVPVFIRRTSGSRDNLVLGLIENLQRQDLNPVEEARAYERLADEFNLTQDAIAKSVGKGRSTVANTMRLLSLPQAIQDAIADGRMTQGSARAILALPSHTKQMAFFEKMMKHSGITTRDVEAGVREAAGRKRRDTTMAAAEEELRDHLATKVDIRKKGGSGNVTIHFYSEEEFNELYRRLKGA
jgi:ParB family chromosome partitioning protein